MKKRHWRRVRLIGTLFAFALPIWPAKFTMAAGQNGARVTQTIRNVQLVAPNIAPRSASVNDDNVPARTAVRTGSDSRAELTLRTERWRDSA